MFGNVFDDFLERATGVVILFAVLSWVSFKLVELWNIFKNRHGERLHAELAHYFGEEPPGRFTNYFYWHPLIEPLSQPTLWMSRAQPPQDPVPENELDPFTAYPPGRRPGHIAPETFAAVMLDPFPWPSTQEALSRMLIGNRAVADAPAGEDGANGPVANDAQPMTDKAMDELATRLLARRWEVGPDMTWGMFLGPKSGSFHAGFNETKVDVYAGGRGDSKEMPLERLGHAWCRNQLAPAQLCANILSQLREAENDVDRMRADVARWYREAMDRASGRFQRASMLHVFLVAIVICAALNVNLLTIGEALLRGLGSSDVNQVQAVLNAHPPMLRLISIEAFQPVGQAIQTIAGVLLAAALAALGAPFWYDLLGRISRRTGRGPAPRRDERP